MARNSKSYRVPVSVGVLICGLLSVADRAIAGQAQTTASIEGRVTDESGGVLPGVTVTATSPALQVREISGVTDASGDYRLTPLPIGTYVVVYTLTGFQSVRHEGLRLTAGFIARVDAVLKVGVLAETVTVSGVTPVVDAASTSAATALTRETLEANPLGRAGILSLFEQSPSVRQSSGDDVGGERFNDSPSPRVYGMNDTTKTNLLYDGINTTSGGNSAISQYLDYSSFDEVRMQTMANDVEVPNEGLNLQIIVKSGGNEFHGSGYYEGTTHSLQWKNVDTALASKGIKAGGKLDYRQDGSFELGGRLIRDKVWFYGNVRGRKMYQDALGIYQADGKIGRFLNEQANWTDKFSWQITPKHRLIFLDNFVKLWKDDTLLLPADWSALSYKELPEHSDKAEWQWVPTNTIVVDAQVARYRISVHYPVQTTDVQRMDIVTGKAYGLNSSAGNHVEHWRPQGRASMTWFKPRVGGDHQFKVGYDDVQVTFYRGNDARPQGNYALLFASGVPFELATLDLPNTPFTSSRSTGIYGADKWTLGRRLTLNLGVRWARDAGWIPAQCRAANAFFSADCTKEINARTMYSWSPRLFAAYDVTGTGKTAIKGGWGRFNDWRDQDNFLNINPEAALENLYRWRVPNGNAFSNYEPGQVNLDVNSPDFITQTSLYGGTSAVCGTLPCLSSQVVNPNEPETYEDEYSLSLEQELIANLGVRVTGVYARRSNIGGYLNLARPSSLYTIANRRPDPGNPGAFLTWYEYPAAYVGSQFNLNQRVLLPNGTETFKTIEVSATKRLSRKWQLLMSYSATKSDVPVPAESALNPNSSINTANRTWEWIGRGSGIYQLPRGVNVSATYELLSGTPTARTVALTGGGTIPSITLNAAPIGSVRFPTTQITSLRLEKRFALGGGRSITGRANLFNLFNVNTPTALNVRTGSSFLFPTAIEPPRIATFAVTYGF